MANNSRLARDDLALINRRLALQADAIKKVRGQLKTPTHPIYAGLDKMPDDPVETQVAFVGDAPYYYRAGAWHPFATNGMYEDDRLIPDDATSGSPGEVFAVVFDGFPPDLSTLELEWNIVAAEGGPHFVAMLLNDDTFGGSDSYQWNFVVPNQLLSMGTTYADDPALSGGYQAAVIGVCAESFGAQWASGSIRMPNYSGTGAGGSHFPIAQYAGVGMWSEDGTGGKVDVFQVGGCWYQPGPITKITVLLAKPDMSDASGDGFLQDSRLTLRAY